jgi:dethiobiotin synthetase
VGIFIAGTDTSVGKTLVSGLLARYVNEASGNAVVQKWIQTGSAPLAEDVVEHFSLMKKDMNIFLKENAIDFDVLCPYCFKLPASPHLAAKKENVEIEKNKIIDAYRLLEEKFETVFVEGAGGALVPYSDDYFILDIVSELEMPVIVVSENKLGSINRALCTIEVLKVRGLKVLGIVFNQAAKDDSEIDNNKDILDDNPKVINRLSGVNVFGCISNNDNADFVYNDHKDIFEKIYNEMKLRKNNLFI